MTSLTSRDIEREFMNPYRQYASSDIRQLLGMIINRMIELEDILNDQIEDTVSKDLTKAIITK